MKPRKIPNKSGTLKCQIVKNSDDYILFYKEDQDPEEGHMCSSGCCLYVDYFWDACIKEWEDFGLPKLPKNHVGDVEITVKVSNIKKAKMKDI